MSRVEAFQQAVLMMIQNSTYLFPTKTIYFTQIDRARAANRSLFYGVPRSLLHGLHGDWIYLYDQCSEGHGVCEPCKHIRVAVPIAASETTPNVPGKGNAVATVAQLS
jgi:hypothetical protein